MGTPVAALIEAAGGLPADAGKVINGGPMMGRAMVNLDSPVTKGCSGITVMTRPRRPAPRGFAVHQVRQVRGCLPDGARTLLPLEDDPEEGLGGSWKHR